jgi:hypothetical protein
MSTVRVVIFDHALDAMHAPGGMIYEEMRRNAREVAFLAKLDAPKRTGRLAASIRMSSETRTSRRRVGFVVRADAPHASWVHEGTYGPITPTTFPYMRVPAFPERGARGTSPSIFRREVAGQAAQPFMRNNLEYVMSPVAR